MSRSALDGAVHDPGATADAPIARSGWVIEYAWQCAEHAWNTCPLTYAALRFSALPCCGRATAIASRERPVRAVRKA